MTCDWDGSRWIGLGPVQEDDLHPIRTASWLRPTGIAPAAIIGVARDITLPAVPIRKADLHVVLQGRSCCWEWARPWISVNGSHRPLWRDQWDLRAVISYDIAAELRPGINRLAMRTFADDAAALIARIDVECADGTCLTWASDAGWQARAWGDETDDPSWDQAAGWDHAEIVGAWGSGPWPAAHWRNQLARRHATALLRRTFDLPRPAVRTRLTASACGLYRATIDGLRIGDHELSPGLTEYRSRIDAQTYDLGPLAPGPHTLACELADGWYTGRIFIGNMAWGAESAFRAVLVAEHDDGSITRIGTDDGWRGTTGAGRSACLFAGEQRDLTREPGPWMPVRCLQPDVPLPTPATHPPVRVLAERPAADIRRQSDGSWRIDLGQNLAGRLRLRVRTAPGSVVTVRHAEVLTLDGGLYTEALRTARATDTYTCPGGEITLEPVFSQHGFRYADVSGAAEVIAANALVLGSDLPETGSFACSDERLQRFLSCIRWGALSNAISIPTDCPQRDERAGWSDAQGQWPTWCLLRDHRDFFATFVDSWFALQHEDGYLPDYAPQPIPLNGSEAAMRSRYAWGCTGIELPHLLWRQYGLLEPARKHWCGIRRYLDHRRRSDVEHDEAWNLGDWLSLGEPTPHPLLNHAWYIMTLRQAAELADAMHRRGEAVELDRLARESATRWRQRWLTDGRLAHPSQTAAVVALHAGLVPAAAIPAVLDDLSAACARDGLTTGFLGAGRILRVLHDHGRHAAAWDLALRETQPSWLAMLAGGATTLWERWDSYDPERGPLNTGGMNSYNHASFGAYGSWLFRIAGLQQAAADVGWRRVRCAPSPGPLRHASASYRCDHGVWESAWRRIDGRFELSLSVPAGCTAEVVMPGSDRIHIVGAATATRYNLQATLPTAS